ncbi:unnamed protein product [Paramecium pentaurelia]|uniref:Uncharacterized protein n=1 Tax=Paramecium pentaurelia TaxID=43138 RepID=A0A8S1VBI5_9CILI|nr:unnamed protein product [Paramecium pentaurelia]
MDDAYSRQASTPADRKSTLESMRNENMNFVDSNDVIVEYYKNQQVSGLDRYFLEIEQWLDEDKTLHTNTPLVLEADDGIGKKTLLVKWMEYHARNKKGRYPDFIIPHFATQSGKNSNYYYAIYRILIKLREALNIKQKVELLEEKLRRYFQYWLEICSRQLEQQIINGAEIIYDKVILVFEGIDNFREILDMHREANVNFWLPKYFPTNIKVIVTAERQSSSMRLLKPDCQVIPIVSDKAYMKQMVNNHLGKNLFIQKFDQILDIFIQLNYRVRNQPLFVRSYFSVFVPYPTDGVVEEHEIDIQLIENILDPLNLDHFKKMKVVEDLFQFQLEYFSKVQLLDKDKFQNVLLVLALTQKGLTYPEIESVCDITQQEWKRFLVFFKVYIMKHRDLWLIHNEIFKKVVINQYYQDVNSILELHDKIAATIDKITPNSIRKLEEQTFQLFSAKNYFALKEVISIIENFLLLFNPSNKYDLCRYWQSLEENGFDPVLEYNKAVEGFQIHYHPNAEDMFRIIIQISRFLKEFGDFETKNTPVFRHPPIIGILSDLYDIGLLYEILKLDLYYDKAPELKQFDPAKHLKRVAKPLTAPVLSKQESLNVEIAQNRAEIRSHYLKQLSKPVEPTDNEEELPQSVDQLADEMDQKLRKTLQAKEDNLSEDLLQQSDRESTDYYYKRWIWIQFPWACMSVSKKCDYSTVIKQCFSSATDYMSVEDENAFTESALKIALEAKRKKKEMYEQKYHEEVRLQIIPQISVLQQKSMDEVFRKQKREQLDFSSLSSARFDRSTISVLPPLSTRSSQAKKTSSPDPIYPHLMFITSDFTDSNHLNEESKSIKLTQSSLPNDGKQTMQLLDQMKLKKERIKVFSTSSVQHNSYKVTEIFPIIKGSIQNHSSQQLNVLNGQLRMMKGKLDQISYENLQLAKTYKLLKIMDFNKGYLVREMNSLDGLKQTLEVLKKQTDVAEKELKRSYKMKTRVKKILKICRDNKQQNEEYIRNLNYLTRNFIKLIKFEEQEIKKSQLNIKYAKRQFEEFLKVYKEKRNHQRNLIIQIKDSLQQKKLLDKIFQDGDKRIAEQANASIKKLRKKLAKKEDDSKNKKNKEAQEKEEKHLSEKLQQLKASYEKVKGGVFDIMKENYNQTNQFIDFMAQKDRKSEYEIKLSERRQKYTEIKEQEKKLNEQLHTYQNAYLSLNIPQQQETKIEDPNNDKIQSTNLQKQEQYLKKLMLLQAKLASSLEQINEKSKIKKDDSIIEELKRRQQLIIKNEGEASYQNLIKDKYDINSLLKKSAPFYFPKRYTVHSSRQPSEE